MIVALTTIFCYTQMPIEVIAFLVYSIYFQESIEDFDKFFKFVYF